VVKAFAPLGHPQSRELAKGRRFWIDWDLAKREGCLVFFGSAVESPEGGYVTLGSRAVEVLAHGDTPEEAYRRVERCAAAVRGEGLFHRSDIASLVSKGHGREGRACESCVQVEEGPGP